MSLISIITPVFNSEKYIEACMRSVLAQSYGNWEHILVDDCSDDNSPAIIQRYVAEDPRVKYIRLQHNSGAGLARNKGIELAAGEYIAFLDSDDLWYPEKLKKQLEFMTKNNYAFTFTSYEKINDRGKKTGEIVAASPVVTYRKALYKNPVGCLTAMYNVAFYGKQYMPEIRKRQDYALWLNLLKKADGFGLNEVLSSYRERTGSISSNKIGLIKYEWHIYRKLEKLSIVKSLFYVLTAILLKMKSYF